jgi:hypothetical protein
MKYHIKAWRGRLSGCVRASASRVPGADLPSRRSSAVQYDEDSLKIARAAHLLFACAVGFLT